MAFLSYPSCRYESSAPASSLSSDAVFLLERSLDPAHLQQHLHDQINQIRERHHLPPLQQSPVLTSLALAHSQQMARTRIFSHDVSQGKTREERRQAAIRHCDKDLGSYKREGIAENIFYYAVQGKKRKDAAHPPRLSMDRVVQRTLQGWLSSASHRQNILEPAHSETGIGVVLAGNREVFITQDFC